MKSFSNFLKNLKSLKAELSEEERWLICLSIWLHDIGVLITSQEEKEKHNENSVRLLRRPEFSMIRSMLGDNIVKCLKYIVKYHSSNFKLDSIPNEVICPNVRLRLVCAIFRLLDGCDITSARTSPILYNLLKGYKLIDENNMKYWDAHLSISSAVFQGKKIVIDCKKSERHKLLTEHLKSDLKEINKILEEEDFPQFEVRIVHLTLEAQRKLLK